MHLEWVMGLIGGLLIGMAAAVYLLVNGRIMGASGIVGGLVREAEQRRCELNALPFEVYASASPLFDRDVLGITVDSALAARDIPGGTAPRQVRLAAAQLRSALGSDTLRS